MFHCVILYENWFFWPYALVNINRRLEDCAMIKLRNLHKFCPCNVLILLLLHLGFQSFRSVGKNQLQLWVVRLFLIIFLVFNLIYLLDFAVEGVASFADNVNFFDYDVFFEITEPDELRYTYKVRPAKDFGEPLVSNFYKLIFIYNSFIELWIWKIFMSYRMNLSPDTAHLWF